MDDLTRFRIHVLRSVGAGESETEELLYYNQLAFDQSNIAGMTFPLPDEKFVSTWESYAREVQVAGSILPLEKYLVQLRFPVRQGMSRDSDYVAATRTGEDVDRQSLGLRAPDRCSLLIHSTFAGRIPILIAGEREDFELLVQALTKRNEPAHIPESMGACMIAGYRNWHRIRQIAKLLPGQKIADRLSDPGVQEQLQDKSNYQDRFMVLSRGFYSGVPPEELGLTEHQWKDKSLVIRREHECTHYFTRRVFFSMRNNLLDEIIADYCGIVAAHGCFRQDWMLNFFGLEKFPSYRPGARLENYRGDPPLSAPAFSILQKLVKQSAENLQIFDCQTVQPGAGDDGRLRALLALCGFTLEELASAEAPARLRASFASPARGHSVCDAELPPSNNLKFGGNALCEKHST